MNPVSKSPLPAVLDPVVAAIMEQLEEQVEAKRRVIAAKDLAIAKKDAALAAAEAIIEQLKEALRLERIRKYGKQSEKLSDLRVSRTRARARGAVSKMEVGLPKPACRSRLQTARCCCAQKWRGGERPWKRHSVRMSGVY